LLLPWTTLQVSSRALLLRRVGIWLALGSCAALAIAAFASDPFQPVPALLGVAGGLCTWVLATRRSTNQLEVGVSSTGQIKLRERDAADAGTVENVQLAFASSWLISLRRGTMLVAIWPDSLPQSTYRQLWVHLRWGRTMPSDDRGTVPRNRANSVDQ
jgi:hypothetical protein